jgi:hypothetical protein
MIWVCLYNDILACNVFSSAFFLCSDLMPVPLGNAMLKIHRSTKAKARRNKTIDKQLDAFTSQWPRESVNRRKYNFSQQGGRMAYVRSISALHICELRYKKLCTLVYRFCMSYASLDVVHRLDKGRGRGMRSEISFVGTLPEPPELSAFDVHVPHE